MNSYPRATKYLDLDSIYSRCSGPGALRTAEFVADKLDLRPDTRLLDIGVFKGEQTCFLAKEYGSMVVAVDPWLDDFYPDCDHRPFVDHLRRNADRWGVADRVLGLQLGVPDLKFADVSFDAAYSTTAFEMLRGLGGVDHYRACLAEVRRVLRPGGLFGLAEPMHLGGEPPPELAPFLSDGIITFGDCLTSIGQVEDDFLAAGFEIVESGYAPDGWEWWLEFAAHDVECKANPERIPRMLEVDGGRWIGFGYVIARRAA